MKVKVKLEGAREFRNALNKFGKHLDKSGEEMIQDLAIGGARRLATQTEPFGSGKKAREQGENATQRDISKVYQSVGKIAVELKKIDRRKAAAYLEAINDGNILAAEKIAEKALAGLNVGNFDAGKLHSRSRRKGKVDNPSKTANPVTGGLASYRRGKNKKTGLAKSGWVSAIQSVRTKKKKPRFAGWLKNHPNKYGRGKIRGRGLGATITLHNKINYLNRLLTRKKIAKALGQNYKSILRRYQKQLDAKMKRL